MQLSDPAVENQLARLAPARVGALLASDLEDSAVPANRVTQDAPFLDGQAQRFLQKDIFACFSRRDGGQDVPMVGRGDADRVDVRPGDQVPVIAEGLASIVGAAGGLPAIMGLDGLLSVLNTFGVDVAYGDDLGLLEAQNLPHVAHTHPPDADKAERDAIARRIGPKNRRRHDGRPQ